MAMKKNKKTQTDFAKKVKDTTNLISATTKQVAEQVSEKAFVAVGATKENFGKDVDDLVSWVENRNKEIKSAHYEVDLDSLPTLAKVISGGEAEIEKLPENEKKKYTNYFKHNASRIALLTAINPLFGLGTAGAEMAASGMISTKASIGTTAVGAGAAAVSSIAALSIPSCLSVAGMQGLWWIPQLRAVGMGLMAVGAGATLFQSISKFPQGKLIVETFDKTQAELNNCYDQFEANFYSLNSFLSEKMTIAVEAMQSASKKIAITIDDALHSDQNMRLMQYQEIVLNQHNALVEMENTFADLMMAYSIPMEENQTLVRKIEQYKVNMQLLVCGSEYLK